MKLSLPFLLSLFALITLSSCQRDHNDQLPIISLDKQNIQVNPGGGQDSVILNSNVAWTVENLPTWIRTNVNSGNSGDTKLVFSVDGNKGTQSRTAEISFKGAGVSPVVVKITQQGTAPFITVDTTSLQVGPGSQTDSIVITSNIKWNLAASPTSPWIAADKASGDSGTTKVALTISANSTANSRTGEIVISATVPTVPSITVGITQGSFSLSGFSPQSGPAKTAVTLTGSFGINPTVLLNNVACTITSNNASEIIFTVPDNATAGKITVSFDSTTLTASSDFTVTNTWVKVSDYGLKGRLQDGVSFVWNNKIYFGLGVFGGDQQANRDFWVFDPSSNQWSQGPSIPSNMYGRQQGACVFLNGISYMGFGFWGGTFNDVWSFDPATHTWKALPTPSSPSSMGSILPVFLTVNNAFYAGQPAYDKGILKKYEPQLNGWFTATTNFPEVQGASCFTIGNYAYITGGSSPSSGATYFNTTYRFDPATNTTTRLSDNPSFMGVANAPSAVLNNKGYLLFAQYFYEYDPATDKWKDMASTFTPDTNGIEAYQMAVLNGSIYAWHQDGTMYKYIPL